MGDNFVIECSCRSLGGLAGGLSARTVNRVVCYCDDCQLFAHFLGDPLATLDANGGTEIFQTSSARLEFTRGTEHLRCMRLSSAGLLRWYAGCCRTPVANTIPHWQVPFAGLIHGCLADPSSRERLGPVRARVQGRFATGDRAGLDAVDGILPPGNLLRFVALLARARVRGDHKRSPFIDPRTRGPVVSPEVLGRDECAQLRQVRIELA